MILTVPHLMKWLELSTRHVFNLIVDLSIGKLALSYWVFFDLKFALLMTLDENLSQTNIGTDRITETRV